MIEPYYSDDAVTLYHGRSPDLVDAVVSARSVDTVLTDPPFFMPAQQYAGRTESWQRAWADTSILATWWELVVQALTSRVREDGHFLSFCDQASYPVFYPAVYSRWPNIACLTWDKAQPGMGSAWRISSELIIAARGRRAFWAGGAKGTVLRFPPVHHSQRLHPVDKPVSLLAELLAATTPAGGTVLDPFTGGGSTLAAARTLGMRAIGIEAEERYCEIAARRLAGLAVAR
jgi:site-specific DNA-methyltransferase (adenine-specific)